MSVRRARRSVVQHTDHADEEEEEEDASTTIDISNISTIQQDVSLLDASQNLNSHLDLDATVNILTDAGESYEEEDDDEDDDEELPEAEKRQMQQLTSIVDAAYRRVDRHRVHLPDMDSSMTEVELSAGAQRLQDYSITPTAGGSYTTLLPVAVPASSSYTPLQLATNISCVESQTTNTSDFQPPIEDGEQFLARMKETPNSLEKALSLNQALQRRLTGNIQRLEEGLKHNLQRQLLLHDEEEEDRVALDDEKLLRESDSRYFLRISSFCRPYFKTKTGMPAPMNDDAKYRIKHGYLDLYQARRRPWTHPEQRRLKDVALEIAREAQVAALQQSQRDVRRAVRAADPDDGKVLLSLEEEQEHYKKEEKLLQALPLRSVPVPQHLELDWIKIAAQATDGHRTTDECQHIWQTLLTPNVSQADFSEKDDISIQTAVRSFGKLKPDWAAISRQLSEPRSPFQVFRRYQSYIAPALTPIVWTDEARQELVQLVEELREGQFIPWTQVHQQMPGFTRIRLQTEWKKLNPNRRKGPFTRQEDDVFIKGLYRFGVNFQQILKFMPQRNIDQLKDRFRRNIVANVVTEWTSEMDHELREVTGTRLYLNNSFWRRLAMVDAFASSGKDAGMLRLRYLTLKMWRELTLTDDLPPPLFPVSITTREDDIHELKFHFLHADMVEVRAVVDKINAGNHIKSALRELEQRRRRLHQEHDHHHTMQIKKEVHNKPMRFNHLHLHHLHQQMVKSKPGSGSAPIDLRAVSVKRTAVLTWPEQIILDFFMPSKQIRPRTVSFETDFNAIVSIRKLMVVLHVRPLPVQPREVEVLMRLNIRESEMSLINSMVDLHTCGHRHENTSIAPCVWCSGAAVPECIALLPPSAATISALQSLMLHRAALNSMAQETFVLHKFTGADVRQLGPKPKSVRAIDPRQTGVDQQPTAMTSGKIHITAIMDQLKKRPVAKTPFKKKVKWGLFTQRNQSVLKVTKAKRPKWNKRSIVDIYKSYKAGKLLSQYQGPKKVETGRAGAAASCAGGVAIKQEKDAVVGDTKAKPAKRGGRGRPKGSGAGGRTPASQKKKATYGGRGRRGRRGRGRGGGTAYRPPAVEDTDEEDVDGISGVELSEDEEAAAEAALSAEDLKARAEADNLLWHRFLAVFLLPAALTLGMPASVQQLHVNQQYEALRAAAVVGDQLPVTPLVGSAKRILEEVQPKQRSGNKRGRRSAADAAASKAEQPTPPPPSRTSVRVAKQNQVEEEILISPTE